MAARLCLQSRSNITSAKFRMSSGGCALRPMPFDPQAILGTLGFALSMGFLLAVVLAW